MNTPVNIIRAKKQATSNKKKNYLKLSTATRNEITKKTSQRKVLDKEIDALQKKHANYLKLIEHEDAWLQIISSAEQQYGVPITPTKDSTNAITLPQTTTAKARPKVHNPYPTPAKSPPPATTKTSWPAVSDNFNLPDKGKPEAIDLTKELEMKEDWEDYACDIVLPEPTTPVSVKQEQGTAYACANPTKSTINKPENKENIEDLTNEPEKKKMKRSSTRIAGKKSDHVEGDLC